MLDFFDIKFKYKTGWCDGCENFTWYFATLPENKGLFFISISCPKPETLNF